jgi:membrane-associated phospholipid phosphatase
VSIALLCALWTSIPRWRVPGLLISVLLQSGVIIGNFHWLSDVIAGAFLGVTIGWSRVRLSQARGRKQDLRLKELPRG